MLSNVERAAVFLEEEVKDFADVAVVGISGGVDSAVVASICCAALGEANVFGLSMPYDDVDASTFNSRSAELADKLGLNHLVMPIAPPTDAATQIIHEAVGTSTKYSDDLHKLTLGNSRSRMRMLYLYAVAGELSYRFEESKKHKHVAPVRGELFSKRVRVMGTGNASEDLIGYDTKGGDALADLFVIGDLFKSEVYQLAKYYEVPSSILEAAPSAGLYEGQTDAVELGYSYEELEPALSALHDALTRGVADSELCTSLPEFSEVDQATAQFVVKRFLGNAHKHRAPKVVQIRHTELVKDIWRQKAAES